MCSLCCLKEKKNLNIGVIKSCLFYTLLGRLTFHCGQNEESNEGVVDGAGRLGNTRQDCIGIQEVAGENTHICH